MIPDPRPGWCRGARDPWSDGGTDGEEAGTTRRFVDAVDGGRAGVDRSTSVFGLPVSPGGVGREGLEPPTIAL